MVLYDYNTDIFGTGALEQQQYAVYSDLAMVLETDFAGGNKILTELSDFYTSCIAAQLMDDSEFIDILIPIMRKLYQDLGMFNDTMCCGKCNGYRL